MKSLTILFFVSIILSFNYSNESIATDTSNSTCAACLMKSNGDCVLGIVQRAGYDSCSCTGKCECSGICEYTPAPIEATNIYDFIEDVVPANLPVEGLYLVTSSESITNLNIVNEFGEPLYSNEIDNFYFLGDLGIFQIDETSHIIYNAENGYSDIFDCNFNLITTIKKPLKL